MTIMSPSYAKQHISDPIYNTTLLCARLARKGLKFQISGQAMRSYSARSTIYITRCEQPFSFSRPSSPTNHFA